MRYRFPNLARVQVPSQEGSSRDGRFTRPPQDLFFLRDLRANKRDFLPALRRGAGLDKRSVLATTVPRVDPIVCVRLVRRPLFFLAGLRTRLFSFCSPEAMGMTMHFHERRERCSATSPAFASACSKCFVRASQFFSWAIMLSARPSRRRRHHRELFRLTSAPIAIQPRAHPQSN